ncbi:DsbA family protein [Alkalimarinus sediminis]|uniref:DsbA family protein n=1 Tax=Alkalimarinus sediminis TaxID=1632866 RepID=A0A9E8KPB7_9ALTE|nr:DsbA family protein [Alkalimarinus sediminis]UZW73312.1 DsbA family protein [Alkalimarinus sediminis]
MRTTLYYFHDPMCSWCWGYSHTWNQLQQLLPDHIGVEYVVGGLAPDSDIPMPASMAQTIQTHWKRIESELGTRFNYDFWVKCSPKRSTYPACRAVLAAEKQQQQKAMIQRIQEAYYLEAKNPSEQSTLIKLAEEIGLDPVKFTADINSTEIEQELQDQIQLTRQSPIQGFPSLLLVKGSIHYPTSVGYPIPVDYHSPHTTIEAILRC